MTYADNLESEAKAKGFDAIVIQRDGLYKVQIGAFATQENADALVTKANSAGYHAIVVNA